MKVTCRSQVDNLVLEVDPKMTFETLKYTIAEFIEIDAIHFRLAYKGKIYPDSSRLDQVPGGIDEENEISIEFNKTEKARKQTFKHVRKVGLELAESPATLKEQLAVQQKQFDKEEKKLKNRNLDENEYFPDEIPSAEGDKKKSKFGFGKKKTPEDIFKKRVKDRADNIEKSLKKAYKEIPGFYSDSGLLFIKTKVNGHEVLAALDSGAGSTVMLMDCAKRVGIFDLVDSRFGGTATGMGTTSVLGRVHRTSIEIGNFGSHIHLSVLSSGSVEFLIGIDMMKRFKMVIDMVENCLILEGQKIPFLDYNEIPERIEISPVMSTLAAAFNSKPGKGPIGKKLGGMAF